MDKFHKPLKSVPHRNICITLLPAAAVLAAVVVLAAASGPPDSGLAARAGLERARATLSDHVADIQAHGGSPAELLARLDADLSTIPKTDVSTPQSEWERFALTAQLDESLVDQLVSGVYVQPADVRGAAAVLVRASADTSLQPLAVYVPRSYDPKRRMPLVIMLHNQGQTENELLATPFLRALADQTGAIFAAPFARGDHAFEPGNHAFNSAALSDVYDALALLEGALSIDRQRAYLSGVSVGGFGIFMIAPQHPERWSALLAIAGTLTNEDKESVARAMAGKQVFLVIGADDPRVKAEYVRGAAAYLLANGVQSRYYEQPRGGQSLQSLQPAVENAWHDMFSAVRNVAPDVDIPSPQPAASQRT